MFGCLEDIIHLQGIVYFALAIYETIDFNNHFYSFEIHPASTGRYRVLLPSELHSYQALTVHTVGELHLITLKYDVDP